MKARERDEEAKKALFYDQQLAMNIELNRLRNQQQETLLGDYFVTSNSPNLQGAFNKTNTTKPS